MSIATVSLGNATALIAASLLMGTVPARRAENDPAQIQIKLSEWQVELSQPSIGPGKVTFTVANAGSIPHAFEVEGEGLEQKTEVIQPGASVNLTLELKPGTYELYCPIGDGSHEKLGMLTHLEVAGATKKTSPTSGYAGAPAVPMAAMGASAEAATVRSIRVAGGGPVIQILPGPFPFPDSAAPILKMFGDEREGLESQVRNGPYSNNVARIKGTFNFAAWDLGAVRDSVDGVAEFTTRDGSQWKLVVDRVQTRDVPHHPRFGGVILGLYYHGNTGVHTPLVPTINSAVALWAFAHLYRSGALVTDQAMVHVMLLSHTRRDGDFALACWDCSKNPVDELQLQVLPGPGEPPFDAPGGFLFINWEKSGSR